MKRLLVVLAVLLPSTALAQLLVKKGTVDVSAYVFLGDSTTGAPETGLTITGLDLQYVRYRVAPSAKADATALAATDSAHTDNACIEVDATDQPGLYRCDFPDAAFATGVPSVVVSVIATGVHPAHLEYQLTDFDPQDAVRLGLTALPNAAADAAGGLAISDAGGLDLDAQRADVAAVLVDTGTDGVLVAAADKATLVDLVWDEPTSGHTTAGTTGKALTDAGSAGDPWTTALPGAYGAGTAGKIVGDNINATVSSRATPAQVATELATYDGPTNAEMVARTLVAASYFDPAADTVAAVTTVTNLTNAPTAGDLTATMKLSVNAEADTALTDYDGPTHTELLNLIRLALRKDAALATDLSALLTTVNADLGSGPGAYANTADSLEASQAEHDVTQGFVDDIGAAGAGLTVLASQASVNTIDGIVDAIVLDTAELQGDWVNGGRLDLILDARASQASVDTIDGIVDSILADTGTDGVVLAANAITSAKVDDTAWDELIEELFSYDATLAYATATAGSLVKEIADNAGGSALTVAGIADGVWDEILSGHLGAGSTGEALNAAGAAGDPWITALPGAYGAGSAGFIIGTNVNATVSSRATPAQVATELATYDAPTFAELDARTDAIDSALVTLQADSDLYDTDGELATAIWNAATATYGSAGSYGLLLETNLDALISSRLATAGYTAPLSAAATESEVNDALVVLRLDELMAADSDIDGAAPPTVGSVFHELMTKSAASFTYDQATDSPEAIRDRGDAAWTTATGFSTHSAADVWSAAARTLTAATNITSTGGTTVPQTGDSFARIGATGSGLTSLASQASLDTVDGIVDNILVDTAALQTDWVDGGRLDLILDARASQASVDAVKVDTAATLADTGTDGVVVAAGSKTGYTLTTADKEDIRALRTGTADSGTTTTMVDAALTEADADYFQCLDICFTSGTLLDQCRKVTGFTAATDTVTFSPATTQAVGTHTYEFRAASCN